MTKSERIYREDIFWKHVLDRVGDKTSARVSRSSMDAAIGDTIKFNDVSGRHHAWVIGSGWMCANLKEGKFIEHRTYDNFAEVLKNELCSSPKEWAIIEEEAKKVLAEQAAKQADTNDSTIMADCVVTNPFLLTPERISAFSAQRKAEAVAERMLEYCRVYGHTEEEALNTFKYTIRDHFGNAKSMHSLIVNKKIARDVESVFDAVRTMPHEQVSVVVGDLDIKDKNNNTNQNRLQNRPAPSLTPSSSKKDKKKEEEERLAMHYRPKPTPFGTR